MLVLQPRYPSRFDYLMMQLGRKEGRRRTEGESFPVFLENSVLLMGTDQVTPIEARTDPALYAPRFADFDPDACAEGCLICEPGFL